MRREANQSGREPLHPRSAGKKTGLPPGRAELQWHSHENAFDQGENQRTYQVIFRPAEHRIPAKLK
jgi:hypothetical protein